MKPRSLSTDALRLGLVLLLLATATPGPPGDTTVPGDVTATKIANTTPPGSTNTTSTRSPSTTVVIRISLLFRIVNRIFDNSLLDPNSINYLKLQVTIQIMYGKIYGCPTCPNGQNYLGLTDLRFSQGSVVTESVLLYRVSDDTSISAADIEQQLRQRLGRNNSFDGLQLDSIRASFIGTSSPTSAPAPLVPGWGIALLVLVCIGLVLSILLFILLIISMCCRRSQGSLDLFSSMTSYQTMSK
ncbi:mucin-1-like [Lepidochelys kempii]|uniref:mucin-1-like n=1 Tax=Lepidochelys kempii TaxID=8472 RepID=UPI003C6F201E